MARDYAAIYNAAYTSLYSELDREWDAEGDFQARVIVLLNAFTDVVNREAQATRRGVSDLNACINGRFVALELKDKDGEPSRQQLKYIARVRDNGGIAGVCSTFREVLTLLHEAVYASR